MVKNEQTEEVYRARMVLVPGELAEASWSDPLVHQGLVAYAKGVVTYTEALEALVVSLSRERKRLIDEAVEKALEEEHSKYDIKD